MSIADTLREAVRRGLLTGWYKHVAGDGSARWVVVTPEVAPPPMTDVEIANYADMLRELF